MLAFSLYSHVVCVKIIPIPPCKESRAGQVLIHMRLFKCAERQSSENAVLSMQLAANRLSHYTPSKLLIVIFLFV